MDPKAIEELVRQHLDGKPLSHFGNAVSENVVASVDEPTVGQQIKCFFEAAYYLTLGKYTDPICHAIAKEIYKQCKERIEA